MAYTRYSVGVVVHDFATGAEKTIASDPPNGAISSFGFAPDGQRLAFSSNTGKGEDAASSLSVQSPDGVAHELFSLHGSNTILFQAWAADGGDLIYSSQTAAAPVPRLWRISALGGPPREMMIQLDTPLNADFVAVSPDGRRIAYTAGRTAFEIWTMEGFLPR